MRRYSILLVLFILPRILIADSILVLGDSLSAAYGFELDQGWVHLLQQNLLSQESHNNSWTVINASVSGETTSGGLARLPQLLNQHKPSVTIIALGANDGLRGQSVQNMRSNLAAMVEDSKNFGAVILLGMRLPPNYGKAYTQAFENSFVAVASEFEINYIPFFIAGVTESSDNMQADNFHPNAAAQTHILANVWPTVKAVTGEMESVEQK